MANPERRSAPPHPPDARDAGVRDRQREETRRRVYEAALHMFLRDGVSASRISDIVQHAGVATGTFYVYFPTKEHVLVQLLHDTSLEVLAAVAELPRRASLERVLSTACTAVTVAWRQHLRLFLEAGAMALKLAGEGHKDADVLRQGLTPYFDAAAERGELTQLLPPALLVDFFLSNLFTAAMAGCASDRPELSMQALLPTVVDLFFNGVGGPKRRPSGRRRT